MKKFRVIAQAALVGTALFSPGVSYAMYHGYTPPVTTPAAEPAAQELRMTSGNFFFQPNKITLTNGRPVKITFQNTGIHTFTVDELGVDIPLCGSAPVAEFTPSKAGTFTYYCKVPGHRERGMAGSLPVQ